MNLVTLRALETLFSFSVFVGILLWAYSSRRKAAFDELALLPFDDTDTGASGTPEKPAEHGHV